MHEEKTNSTAIEKWIDFFIALNQDSYNHRGHHPLIIEMKI
jgi:hypothetical protein